MSASDRSAHWRDGTPQAIQDVCDMRQPVMPFGCRPRPGAVPMPRRLIMIALCLLSPVTVAEEMKLSREQIIAQLAPYDGPSTPGTDVSTLNGKVVTGYQGWFGVPGDGAARGWVHLGRGGKFAPGACSIEIWPDISELPKEDRFPTDFRLADGSVAEMFSSYRRSTVLMHFQWMKDYGI